MPTNDALGDRMKEYENVHRTKVTRRTPLVIRVDGKAFHTYTKGLKRPYSTELMDVMDEVARVLCAQIQGAKFAYVQSDEISIVTRNDGTLKTDVWLSGNIQKMVSVSASIAAVEMTMLSDRVFGHTKRAYFDSRVVLLPNEDEVVNYCIWRQEDATRNAIQMIGQAHFSHKQLHEKNTKQVQEMLFKEKGINFNNEPTGFKRGRVIRRVEQEVNTVHGLVNRRPWTIDDKPPKFVTNKDYLREMFAVQKEAK